MISVLDSFPETSPHDAHILGSPDGAGSYKESLLEGDPVGGGSVPRSLGCGYAASGAPQKKLCELWCRRPACRSAECRRDGLHHKGEFAKLILARRLGDRTRDVSRQCASVATVRWPSIDIIYISCKSVA